jgi:hypothetical protein
MIIDFVRGKHISLTWKRLASTLALLLAGTHYALTLSITSASLQSTSILSSSEPAAEGEEKSPKIHSLNMLERAR